MSSRDGDIKVLAAMASRGADMTKPAHTIHFLYFNTWTAAQMAADELRASGYINLRVHRSPTKSIIKEMSRAGEFSRIAETHAVPSQAEVFTTTDRMIALAQRLGGEYDGWEASIER